MGGVWCDTEDGWRPLAPAGFALEQDLHDLIERSPGMLPLAGSPRLVVLGREVRCGKGWADLIGIEADTGCPVVVEIKLASNADRRAVLTQVLGYAAHIRRLDAHGFESLLAQHLAQVKAASAVEAVTAAMQDPAFDPTAFSNGLADSLTSGRLRCVVVLDSAPADLVELVGYLQDVTNDRLRLDLVTVTAYSVGGRRILVPQLVEPDRSPIESTQPSGAAGPQITRGAQVFADSIEQAPTERRPSLRRLLAWARQLEAEGLAVLYSSTGKGRWVLNLRLPHQQRGLICIWNENGASISPYRTVLEQEAPNALLALERRAPGQIGQGNYMRVEYDSELLDLIQAAYREAAEGSSLSG